MKQIGQFFSEGESPTLNTFSDQITIFQISFEILDVKQIVVNGAKK